MSEKLVGVLFLLCFSCAWGHTWSTAACLVGWTVIVVHQTIGALDSVLYALIMVGAAWPIYRYLTRHRT